MNPDTGPIRIKISRGQWQMQRIEWKDLRVFQVLGSVAELSLQSPPDIVRIGDNQGVAAKSNACE